MIHVSIETIPAKLYFHIQDSGNVKLLTDEKNPDPKELQEIWEHIKQQHSTLPESKENIKNHSLYVRMEQLSSRLECATLSAHHLKSLFDQDLLDILISYEFFPEGYIVESQKKFLEDLKRVDREAEGIQIKIDALKKRFPKKKEGEVVSFDQSVMAYSAFVGSGFIETNTITLTQYYALVNMGKDKIKSLENGKG